MTSEVLDYESPCPTFALAFSPLGSGSSSKSNSLGLSPPPDIKLAVGSFIESYSENHVTVVGLNPHALNGYDDSPHFQPLATAPHPYPPTSLAFSPPRLSESLQASSGSGQLLRTREMLATSSECIRLWDFAQGVPEEDRSGSFVSDARRSLGQKPAGGYQLVLRSQMANSKADYSAPLTSFSWSQLDPSLIVTSSIDTTCTVWDISSSSAITQLIAHDREVYDVCWSTASREIFASVGADGSVRIFDLRSLDHSTILFEAAAVPTAPALLRLKFNPVDPNYIAVSSAAGSEVHLLDVRAPGVPVVELRAHVAPVNGLGWSPDGNLLGTCGDDCQVLVWDLASVPALVGSTSGSTMSTNSSSRVVTPHTKTLRDPVLAYTAPQEVNSIAWSEAYREWLAIGMGKRVRCLRV
ncbi:hypothetical protein CROQUDRAFT_657790 [Cronartium quercuum f. sp. fusiforme G11]|uniref:Uncharacterized protein n=1 Tax=Cronartium quercuum f. sp. fusiforme G11 TaxID=708437 RepID=A0A9P6TBY7_9BASI|nr:hypothetical protein CROQUDRAFT_657790 [Cronartium quercuum f. sp. fusiforme G11]